MKTIKISLTEEEARLVLFCLDKQKKKHLFFAEKMYNRENPELWETSLKTIHFDLARQLQLIKEKFIFEHFIINNKLNLKLCFTKCNVRLVRFFQKNK